MRVDGVETLPSPARTAQYVAFNNVDKDLAVAMADMSILESISPENLMERRKILLGSQASLPKIVVADGNWDHRLLQYWLRLGRDAGAITIFEPVSTAKSTRILPTVQESEYDSGVFYPGSLADIITPNELELRALFDHGNKTTLYELPEWFHVIDALGTPSSGLRVPLALTTTPELVDRGIPQQAIKLLPVFPTILTKLGPQGVLLTQIIKAGDPVLSSAAESQYVLSRCSWAHPDIGGLYVRLYPTEKIIPAEEVVSVNGIGDTFLGALASELAKGKRVQDAIPFAQRAASLTLKSKESVSPELVHLNS